MLVAVIPANTLIDEQTKLALQQADAIELRLDYAEQLNFDEITQLKRSLSIPFIFTLRKKTQGGHYPHDEAQRLRDILSLCTLNPDYFDLEYDTPFSIIQKIKLVNPKIKLICSYHNVDETPDDLSALLTSMQNPFFYAYKIATKANNILDSLRMLRFIQQTKLRFTGICMGEHGECTRILGKIMGNAMTYASLSDSQSTASGQLTIDELVSRYHFKHLNSETKIYALLGDPVHLSLGHVIHNQAIRFFKKNAVYVKLQVTKSDLPNVIQHCRALPFFGFSITMPLKEIIVPLLDEIDSNYQAINSIVVSENNYIGFNTDGLGAIKALAEHCDIQHKTIAILGAGGAARAIAYEARNQHADIILFNRTLEKAEKLAQEVNGEARELKMNQLNKITADVIINTLPPQVYTQEISLPQNKIAMDIIYQPMETPFLQAAKRANCICIPGYFMFTQQAILQIARWF